jgi:hypothetical protein
MPNKRFLNIVIIIFSLLFAGSQIYAQKFSASVDRTTVGQNERFQVYFTFEGSNVNKISSFRPPAFEGMRILSGPNQSSSMQIINGQVSASLTYSFIVTASNIGKVTVGSASVTYEGKTYSTDPIEINVVKGSTKPQQQSSDDSGISKEDLAKNVFIRAIPDKHTALQGEQVTVTYKLYTRLNISSPQVTKLPSYRGFWAEDLKTPNTINFNIEMYEGQRYRVATIKKVALFATKFGNLTVTPFELNIPVLVRKKRSGNSNDLFDQFFNDSFFGRTQTVDFTAKSNQLNLDIKPLPDNAPPSFNGAVGNFDFSANIDKKNVKTNESINLKLTISGMGNMKLLNVPELNLPAGFEKYEPKTSESINNSDIISGRKTIEYLIVPRVPGKKEIPPVKFTYFDLNSRRYVTKSSGPFELNVEQGKGEVTSTTPSGFSKENVKLLSEDIRFIKTSSFDLEKKEDFTTIKSWFWFTLGLPLVLLLTLLGIKKRQDKLYGNLELLRYQKADKMAKSRLKAAKKAMDTGEALKFYTEVSEAVSGYLCDKLNIQKAEYTLDKALAHLRSLNVDESLSERVKTISEKCEFARFAPKSGDPATTKEFYDDAVKLITELDSSIRNNKKKK